MNYYCNLVFLITAMLFLNASAEAQCFSKNEIVTSDGKDFGDTLYIKYQASECGEFGGHQELLMVYPKENRLYITFQKFDADCNSIEKYHGVPPQILKETRTKVLTEKEQFNYEDLFEKLVTAATTLTGNDWRSGYVFWVIKKDRNINLNALLVDSQTKAEYLVLIKQLMEN